MEQKEAWDLWAGCLLSLGYNSALGGSSDFSFLGTGGETELPVVTVLSLKQGLKKLRPRCGHCMLNHEQKGNYLRESEQVAQCEYETKCTQPDLKSEDPIKKKPSTEMNVESSLKLHRVCRNQN